MPNELYRGLRCDTDDTGAHFLNDFCTSSTYSSQRCNSNAFPKNVGTICSKKRFFFKWANFFSFNGKTHSCVVFLLLSKDFLILLLTHYPNFFVVKNAFEVRLVECHNSNSKIAFLPCIWNILLLLLLLFFKFTWNFVVCATVLNRDAWTLNCVHCCIQLCFWRCACDDNQHTKSCLCRNLHACRYKVHFFYLLYLQP